MIMKLAQLPLRERIGLLFAIGFMVLMIADTFVIKPAFRQLTALDAAILAEEAELRQSIGVLQYDDSIREQYLDIKDVLGVTGPESETIESFKAELDELALAHRVQLRSMRHLAPETDASDYLVTYVIDVGDYEAEIPDLLRFLDAIHAAPGLMRVRSVTISSQTESLDVSGAISVTRVMTRALPMGE